MGGMAQGLQWYNTLKKVTGCGHSSTLCLDKQIYKLEYVLLKLILE